MLYLPIWHQDFGRKIKCQIMWKDGGIRGNFWDGHTYCSAKLGVGDEGGSWGGRHPCGTYLPTEEYVPHLG